MRLTIGSDPEFMISNRDGEIVSSIPVIGTDKYDPVDLGDGYVVYSDNTMLETCIPPAKNKGEFVTNIRTAFKKIGAFIGDDYSIVTVPSHHFTEEECSHPFAIEAGCNPEYCAHEQIQCLPPDFKDAMRSAGGHIHIGRSDYKKVLSRDFNEDEFIIGFDSKAEMIKLMDMFVGLPMLLIDDSKEGRERKLIYGKAGRWRPTAYGVEYRTPSNYWLSTPTLSMLIYDLTKAAFETLRDGHHDLTLSNDIFHIINNDAVPEARTILTQTLAKTHPALYDKLMEIEDYKPNSIEEEWKISKKQLVTG